MNRAAAPLAWLLTLAAIALLLSTAQCAERDVGALEARLEASRARVATLSRARAALDARAAIQTPRAIQWRTRWDSSGIRDLARQVDSLRAIGAVVPDSVWVPTALPFTADTAIAACHDARNTCEARLANADSVSTELRTQLEDLVRVGRRPWTSVGLAWDPQGGVGGYVDRDWSRLRAGLSVTPSPQGWRAQVRVGVRW